MPEFGAIGAIVLATSIVGIIVATARYGKFNFDCDIERNLRNYKTNDEEAYKALTGIYPKCYLSREDVAAINKYR